MKLLITICLILLTGCASIGTANKPTNTAQPTAALEKPTIPPEAEQHLADIATISDFKISGRMGVQVEGYGVSGAIQWQHAQDNDEIGLFSPLGNKIAQIVKNSDGVTLTTQEGKVLKAQDAETLTEKTLGWRLPFSDLSDWIVGRPAKGLVTNASWDEKGKLSKLIQNGWEVSYMQYHEEIQHELPSKINLRNPKMNVRLIVENWDTNPQTSISALVP